MKTKNFLLCVLFLIALANSSFVSGQRKVKQANAADNLKTNPKLVVGIVVDQMRYDYLTRFYNQFGNGGFKRLVEQGFNCKNNHFNYAPTSTGPGHASVYTGSTPSVHGIIANNWYDKKLDETVYCASDDSYASVGTASDAGEMSPHRMLVTTMTDQLRLQTQMKGKTIAIALKDRGAVLPGGHTANAAYWFHGKNEGKWITSSYYMNSLPQWVQNFNSSGIVQSYKRGWKPIKNIEEYTNSGTDANLYEGLFNGETTSGFPHNPPTLLDKTNYFDVIKATPFGNALTADFAIEALKQENLGKDEYTDFLAISFSSTDYVGHKFGVNSKEIEDTYIRLDKDLARLLKALDKEVGEGHYTLFLTADHGAIQVPAYLSSLKIPAGYIDNTFESKLSNFLKYTFGTEDIVKNYSNNQVFLDYKVIKNLDLEVEKVERLIAMEFLEYDFVDKVYTGHQMWHNEYTRGIPYILQNGFNQKRSGDILIVNKPGFIEYATTGSSHGSPYIYDTHTPLLFYGKGIKKGYTVDRTEIPDIASTIAVLLGMAFPNGVNGQPIKAVLD